MEKLTYLLAQLNVTPLPHPNSTRTIPTILNIVWGITGAVSVLIIVLAGFRYVTSQGDPSKTAQAKDTILYASIGLAVTILAFSIVTFVVNRVG